MKTIWDYTNLADAYLLRPDYSFDAIKAMLTIAGIKETDSVCDVGAGVAHLTLVLASEKLDVTAVEPNDAMRENGIKRTEKLANVKWHEGTGEQTGQKDSDFDLVTFGSSFNVCDRQVTLKETSRILKPGGWFGCMWNHRDITDPIQADLESIIRKAIPDYGYGTRRENQTEIIEQSKLFDNILHLSGRIYHKQSITDCVEAWRSHGTLHRQAGDKFYSIIDEMEAYLKGIGKDSIHIPYETNLWLARSLKV